MSRIMILNVTDIWLRLPRQKNIPLMLNTLTRLSVTGIVQDEQQNIDTNSAGNATHKDTSTRLIK